MDFTPLDTLHGLDPPYGPQHFLQVLPVSHLDHESALGIDIPATHLDRDDFSVPPGPGPGGNSELTFRRLLCELA